MAAAMTSEERMAVAAVVGAMGVAWVVTVAATARERRRCH